jgi:hypothetical protein
LPGCVGPAVRESGSSSLQRNHLLSSTGATIKQWLNQLTK